MSHLTHNNRLFWDREPLTSPGLLHCDVIGRYRYDHTIFTCPRTTHLSEKWSGGHASVIVVL